MTTFIFSHNLQVLHQRLYGIHAFPVVCIILKFEVDIKEILPFFSGYGQGLYFSQIQVIIGEYGKDLCQPPGAVRNGKTDRCFVNVLFGYN